MTAVAHRFWKLVGESGVWKGIGKLHAITACDIPVVILRPAAG